MEEKEAVILATSVLKASTLANLVDYKEVHVEFVDAKEEREFLKASVPNSVELPDFEDYWSVSFPLLEIDITGRDHIRVEVDPLTKVASIVEDL